MVCLCGTSNQLNAHLAPRPTGTRSLARRQKKVPRWGRSCSVELAEEEGLRPGAFGAWARSPGGEASAPPSNSRRAAIFFRPPAHLNEFARRGPKKKRPDGGAVARWSWRKKRDSNPRTCYSQRFSRPSRSTTLPFFRGKDTRAIFVCNEEHDFFAHRGRCHGLAFFSNRQNI